MDDRLSKIKVGSYVKLKKGFDDTDFYRGVTAGATGWVIDSKVDDDGFPMIFIEWDEFNIKWSGEVDKWAFESHFEILRDHEMNLNENEKYIAELRVASDAALAGDGFLLISVNKFGNARNMHGYLSEAFAADLEPSAMKAINQMILIIADCIKEGKDYINLIRGEDEDESGR